MDSKVVHQFAGKLGLQGESSIIDKTTELLRLLHLKGTSLPQLGDYARCVICLDLATSLYGHEFDTPTAIKLSGFKKPSYLNNRRIVEKILDLSKPIGVSEICVQLNLTEIQAACRFILELFVNSSDLRNIDTAHPQYAAMAVYQLCKMKRIRIQKSKLISFSHLKSSQWSMLEKSWESWAKKNADKLKEYQALSGKTQPNAEMAGHSEESGVNGDRKLLKAAIALPVEEYTDWRERVLKKAFDDLEHMNK